MTTPTTKIVIVAGQEFSVPADADNEAIRAQLLGQGFADVASATISTGKKTIGDVEYPTIEFVKKAGTKGLDGAELAQLLAQVPAAAVPTIGGISREQARLLGRLLSGEMQIGEAMTAEAAALISDALRACAETDDSGYRHPSTGERQCTAIDALPAAPTRCAW